MIVKKIFLIFLSGFIVPALFAQEKNSISGRVLNTQNGSPIANASVYIENSSQGTQTTEKGEFILYNVRSGNFKLVVSYIGFNTKTFKLNGDNFPIKLDVGLDVKPAELEAVTVKGFIRDGWDKWGPLFMENFMGTSTIAREATITNYKALRFRFITDRMLQVTAKEPLKIENKALGYRLNYELDEFTYDTAAHRVLFQGNRYFEDMAKEQKKVSKRWLGNRKLAYEGSIMHFMRSLYQNRLIEEGFEVTRNIRKGTDYYVNISPKPITADSIRIVVDGQVQGLYFKDYLSVVYKNAKSDAQYVNPESGKAGGTWRQYSTISLQRDQVISVESNGNYYPPLSLFLLGYWAWNEKIGHLLPLDYDPHASP